MQNKVVVNGTEISGNLLLSGRLETAHAMVGETLSVDRFSCEVNTADVPFIPADQEMPMIAADNNLYYAKNPVDVTTFNDGDEVFCYSDDTLLGKFYFEELAQTGINRYKITAVSIIGRLLDSKHYGGIYSQVPASQVFSDILSGVTYGIDPDVADATVTGYLPIALRRDNLQQVLAATGSTVRIDNSGAVQITAMSPVPSGSFDTSRCYEGGRVITNKPVTGVKVTEHNYFKAGNVVTLFSDGVDGEELIEFNEPYHSLDIEGGTIVESGANFARIQAKGSVTLTGQPYTHVTRIVTAGNVDTGSTENVKTISACYLANPQIAQALADRFYTYLQCNRVITQGVLTGTEKAGDVVSVINPYTMELETATIKKYDVTLSATNKANAEFLVGFVPQGAVSGFKNHVMLIASGKWTVPAGVTKIRVIAVGAGSGGGGGKNGSEGGDGSWSGGTGSSYDGAGGNAIGGSGGAGGAAGKSGAGGQVFEISLDVTPGRVFDFSCGVGGIGGVANGGEGTEGGATTFGVYSSTYGRKYPYGYAEPKTGLTFAQEGAAGFAGGKGGTATTEDGYGEDGESVNGFAGGEGGQTFTRYSGPDDRNTNWHSGGGGGGAANGAAGGDAEDADTEGDGGNGASGTAGAHATNYGQGGGGGNGGGGGGGGGVGSTHSAVGPNPRYFYTCSGGSAGKGAAGGNGGDGIIIIYY